MRKIFVKILAFVIGLVLSAVALGTLFMGIFGEDREERTFYGAIFFVTVLILMAINPWIERCLGYKDTTSSAESS